MNNKSTVDRHLKVAIAVGLSSVVAGSMIIGTDATEAIGYTPWSRTNAYDLGGTGLFEKYGGVGTGNSQWVNDDLWPSQGGAPEAGADCSGYAGKAWQMSATYRSPATNDRIYPSSTDWHSNNGLARGWGAVQIPLTDPRTRRADVWAYPGHMGMFEGTTDNYGQWKIWHAATPSLGITLDHHYDQWFSNLDARRFKRGNW